MKSRLIATTIISLSFGMLMNATPTKTLFRTYRQNDGSEVRLCKIGDEYFHYYTTLDGLPVMLAKDGGFYYGVVSENTVIVSQQLAHDSIDRNTDEILFVKNINKESSECISRMWKQTRNQNIHQTEINAKRANKSLGHTSVYTGKRKGLVILVDFANTSMGGESVNSDYNRMFNEIGYSEDNHIGSVHDYFFDQSFGQFDLTFDVIGPIQLANNYGYYGMNIDEVRGDKRAGTMVIEACKAIDDIVNYKNYDWNNDGVVETVYIVYAGYGENACDDSSTIWPHKSTLAGRAMVGDGEGALRLDGVTIDVYACSAELAGASGTHRNGIGTPCHEFSHCLGLPDLYDTDYSGAFGMNKWDIMDSGSYSGPNERGEVPYGYSAFERTYLGWMDIEELEAENEYYLQPLNDNPNAFKLTNQGNENEFFIVENHQSNKWFSYVGKYTDIHGMMITHIDYDETAWLNNTVNSSQKHMKQSIVPADKSYGSYNATYKYYNPTESDYRGDLFPGRDNNNWFSASEYDNCGGRLFNKNADDSYKLTLEVADIKEEEGIITFTAKEPLGIPMIVDVKQKGKRLEIEWSVINDCKDYCLELTKIISIFPNRTEKETYDNLKDPYYLTNEINCKQCVVKVKAKNKYGSSEWSDPVRITIDPNAVTSIQADQSKTEYYTVDGIKCRDLPQKGLYLIKQNGRYKKIYIQ